MKRYLAVFLIFSLTALANAQEGVSVPTPVALTWADCVALAARNNPDLLASLAASESSRALYLKSFNGILPQLDLSNTYTDGKSSGLETKVWTLSGNASLDLIDFSQWASIQLAAASMRQSKANLQVTSSNVLLDLYKSFTGVLYSQEAIQVNSLIRDTWKENSQRVALRYQSGRESKGNNMNTQAQYLQASLDLDQSVRDLRVSQQQLSQSVGKDDFSVMKVTGTWNATPVPTPRPDFDPYLAKHPQLAAQTALVGLANLKIARSTLLPTLSLNYRQGTVGPTEFPQNPFWAFTGTVNYPLFAGGPTSTYYASQSAQRAYVKANQDLRSLRNQLRSSMEGAWSAYAAAQDQVRVQNAFLQAAKQRKAESDIRYQSGLMTFDDWIIVVQSYVAFEQAYLKTQQNLILAEAQWRFAIGEELAP